ncbi:class I SAM-dependent methyltransferase [Planctomicrobium piriforme]|uniref:RNA cap guanine-N2 methyltransferase n=1 Tax=Planctomicrobium piriforme TaxID=1576369 RepID=A0A1I3RQL4_9PLAN|nr:class I SAM-dependent methyltransferase [Planctomicrobium piriforme]SFJ47577.1 RNA cap guanine-N2 methyltransferase [Planctomicrobium piriforme]
MDSESDLLRRLAQTPDLLAQAASGGQDLRAQTRLREQYDADLVRAALTILDLRQRAKGRFTRAADMWFDRPGLEQATPEAIAVHKAQRFATAGGSVQDLFCGLGMNAIGLAAAGLNVVAIDHSPVACLRTSLNAAAYGLAERIETRVADDPLLEVTEGHLHLQPQRTTTQQKSVRLEDQLPPLEVLQTLPDRTPGGAITLSPASNFGGKFNNCEIELVSWNGDCKEAVLWYGSLRGEFAMRATLLPSGFTLAGNPWEAYSVVGPLKQYLYDPDPAIVRAGLVDVLAEQLAIERVDAAEEFLTSDNVVDSPAVTGFEIIADLPNNDRDIRNYFRSHPAGDVEIRCRHVPVDAAALRRKLPVTGSGKVALIFARLDGKTRALVGRRLGN